MQLKEQNIDDEKKKKKDLLGLMLTATDEGNAVSFTDQELRDEIFTFFLAGHETTAVTLTWTFYLLGSHPAVLKKSDLLHMIYDKLLIPFRFTTRLTPWSQSGKWL